MDDRSYWYDDEVDFIPRISQQEVQEGHLKDGGTPVRKCDGCADPAGSDSRIWKLVEDFPTKTKHFAIWFCNYCHAFPATPKKPKKGEKFSRYSQYVTGRQNFKIELAILRSEYQAEVQRVKGMLDFIRDEYMNRKNTLLVRQREHEQAYRDNCR
jgi:hypothetical protein